MSPDDEERTSLKTIVDTYRPKLDPYEQTYKEIHEKPELGFQESHTASLAAEHLRKLGFAVETKLGKHGVAGVLHNGCGRTILLRADMDALPVREQTELAYASKARAVDEDGIDKPVMHACGHDMHVSCLMGAAELLSAAKKEWSGTLICLFQPDEERGEGAKAMLKDGLYDKVPQPDYVLGQHVVPKKTGSVAIRAGVFMAARDSFKVTIFGIGGHGSQPQHCVDPVVIAAYIITRLQTIVSRGIAPMDVAAVTCASIHAGDTDNVIPDRLELKVDVRSFDPTVREKVVAGIKRIINAECEAAGVLKSPLIEATRTFPLTVNDPSLVLSLQNTFKVSFGEENTWEAEQVAASENFSDLATPIHAPYVFWHLGGTDAKIWDDAEKLKKPELIIHNHSPFYAPVIQPTLRIGVDALSLAALTFLT